MKIETTSPAAEQVVIAIAGRLDIAGAADVETAFGAAVDGAQTVVVDLTGVPFIASIGIRLLLANAKALSRRSGHMILCGCDPQVDKVLRSTGVDQLIAMVATREDALAGLAAPADGAGSA